MNLQLSSSRLSTLKRAWHDSPLLSYIRFRGYTSPLLRPIQEPIGQSRSTRNFRFVWKNLFLGKVEIGILFWVFRFNFKFSLFSSRCQNAVSVISFFRGALIESSICQRMKQKEHLLTLASFEKLYVDHI